MNRWLQRIRGAFGMGMAWALAWFIAGMALFLVVGPDAADVPFPLGFGMLGFFAGVTFSGILGIVGRRRRFNEISLPRFAGWGAAGGFLFSTLFVGAVALVDGPSFISNLVFLGPLFAAAGAGCAAGSLALARKAEDPTQIEPGGDIDGGSLLGE